MFAVENTRLHDVLLTIEVEGQNAKILCELEGVFQNTHIRHGKVVEFSFEVSLPFSSPTRIPNQPHHLLTFPFLLFFPPPPPPPPQKIL